MSARANALRFLAADAVEAAQSGHPGAPLGMAEMAEALWLDHLKHDPAAPDWPDRDRFVLSNGHASMLLYALLHLSGYDLPVDELKRFRQMGSRTPGHPEVGVTPGVETTTGPLGQGLANAVGMALAEKLLAAEFNTPEHTICDHFTYAFVGDGCLMEGISHEAASLAGALRLSKLVVLYDDNGISIDGHVEDWFADDTPLRFEAYGWNVIRAVDGHDTQAVSAALAQARAQAPQGKPTLICCKTTIGQGAPTKAGGHDVHGAPLGSAELTAMRAALDWPHAPFDIPADTRAAWDARAQGAAAHADWRARFAAYAADYPHRAEEFTRRMTGALPPGFASARRELLGAWIGDPAAPATRKASQNVLDRLGALLPELFGGSADLTGSNLTAFKGCGTARRDQWGRHLSWGVREFGMAAAMNGMALHGGYIPYGGTFATFSDYSRNAIRMAALMRQRVIHVLTHDSIGLGEDGPTHQPVEHAAALRLIPGLDVWRPADQTETAAAWLSALARGDGPSALLLSRQSLAPAVENAAQAEGALRGGYVLRDAPEADVVLIATGSEVGLALAAREALATQGIGVRVVSLPCWEAFLRQPPDYQARVLGEAPRISIEAGVTPLWRRFLRPGDIALGIDSYGESAPAPQLFEHFGLTVPALVRAARQLTSQEI